MGRWDDRAMSDEGKQQSPPTTHHLPHSATLDSQLPPPFGEALGNFARAKLTANAGKTEVRRRILLAVFTFYRTVGGK